MFEMSSDSKRQGPMSVDEVTKTPGPPGAGTPTLAPELLRKLDGYDAQAAALSPDASAGKEGLRRLVDRAADLEKAPSGASGGAMMANLMALGSAVAKADAPPAAMAKAQDAIAKAETVAAKKGEVDASAKKEESPAPQKAVAADALSQVVSSTKALLLAK